MPEYTPPGKTKAEKARNPRGGGGAGEQTGQWRGVSIQVLSRRGSAGAFPIWHHTSGEPPSEDPARDFPSAHPNNPLPSSQFNFLHLCPFTSLFKRPSSPARRHYKSVPLVLVVPCAVLTLSVVLQHTHLTHSTSTFIPYYRASGLSAALQSRADDVSIFPRCLVRTPSTLPSSLSRLSAMKVRRLYGPHVLAVT